MRSRAIVDVECVREREREVRTGSKEVRCTFATRDEFGPEVQAVST
jgi:hypothetical protein